eukprot:6172667-Pleurochrysis_carterae.AAC.6
MPISLHFACMHDVTRIRKPRVHNTRAAEHAKRQCSTRMHDTSTMHASMLGRVQRYRWGFRAASLRCATSNEATNH